MDNFLHYIPGRNTRFCGTSYAMYRALLAGPGLPISSTPYLLGEDHLTQIRLLGGVLERTSRVAADTFCVHL